MNGKIYRIAGPVVVVEGLQAHMFDVVRVGNEKLIGEVIQVHPPYVTVQVYEDTSGIKPEEPVENTGNSLTVELGPGLLKNIYDGIQRPLPELQKDMGDFIRRGAFPERLDKKKKWTFMPLVKQGDRVEGGQIIGTVEETKTIQHKILVPNGVAGVIKSIRAGSYSILESVATLDDGTELRMMQEWPIRIPRPVLTKIVPNEPLKTGQRILDALFPLAKGGTAAVPGPFGAGKTVIQQQLAKWSDTNIVVSVG
ncbi:MAG: V-type ATP synthase subunit A, partial [Candidatus Aenigmarchaeota archaeon]|nr:V-type ATP synthase subunit A [Candidatus Aenigmarchaeota archaeon]